MATRTWVVVVEVGRQSTTLGPYHNQKAAHKDADELGDDDKGQRAWVEPVVPPSTMIKSAPPTSLF